MHQNARERKRKKPGGEKDEELKERSGKLRRCTDVCELGHSCLRQAVKQGPALRRARPGGVVGVAMRRTHRGWGAFLTNQCSGGTR